MTPLPEETRRIARFAGRGAAALAFVAWTLIVLGALVRAHGAGLSCPDWPLCHGQLVPEFDMRIALEWGHRLLAGTLSLGVVALAVTLLRVSALRARFAKSLGLIFGLLGLQVTLGGLTVLLGLAPWTVTAHLVVGNAFALSLAWLARGALDFASETPRVTSAISTSAARAVAVTSALVALQIVLGGLVSSHYAGLACSTFPLCNGDSLAPTFVGPVGLHVVHRLNAYLVAVAYFALAFQLRGSGQAGRLARIGVSLVIAQIAVGAANVLLRLPVEVTALHSALAAGILLTTGLLARESLAASARVSAKRVVGAPALGGAR